MRSALGQSRRLSNRTWICSCKLWESPSCSCSLQRLCRVVGIWIRRHPMQSSPRRCRLPAPPFRDVYMYACATEVAAYLKEGDRQMPLGLILHLHQVRLYVACVISGNRPFSDSLISQREDATHYRRSSATHTETCWWHQDQELMYVLNAVMSGLLFSYLQSIITPLHAALEQSGITKNRTTALEYG
jgi:hypothetical protein